LGGGNSKDTTSNSTGTVNTGPWTGQANYLQDAFTQAQGLDQTGGYTGDYIAGQNPDLTQSYRDMISYGGGEGQTIGNSLVDTGSQLRATGQGATNGALSGLFGNIGRDATGENISAADRYAEDPYISGQVKAAMRDATQTASEQTLPNLYRASAGSGNINSDRMALAQGVVDRGLGQQAGDISAQLRGAARSQGLSLASSDNAQKLQALSQIGSIGNSATGQGIGATAAGTGILTQALGIQNAGAQGLQAGDQSTLDNNIAKSQSPWQNLLKYYSIIGANNWGQNGTTTKNSTSNEQTNPSTMSTIGSGVGIAGGLANLFGL
jgi:hypothetical protein